MNLVGKATGLHRTMIRGRRRERKAWAGWGREGGFGADSLHAKLRRTQEVRTRRKEKGFKTSLVSAKCSSGEMRKGRSLQVTYWVSLVVEQLLFLTCYSSEREMCLLCLQDLLRVCGTLGKFFGGPWSI